MNDRWSINYRKTFLLLVIYTAIGLAVGVLAIVFQQMMSIFNILLLEGLTGHGDTKIVWGERRFDLPWTRPEQVLWWLFPILAGVGGLVTGLIVYRFAPEAAGHGTDEVILAYHKRNGFVRFRASLIKMIASAITLGTGGSGGKEGPIAQIGAGFASFVAAKIPMLRDYRREIMLAGMAAGIAAIFRAPLAGAIFASEILYSKMRYEGRVLIPASLAAAAAYGGLYFIFRIRAGIHSPFISIQVPYYRPSALYRSGICVGGGVRVFCSRFLWHKRCV